MYALLKNSNPKLKLIRCICHSLDNCAFKVSEEFPAAVDFLLREILNWFIQFAKCRAVYKELWETLNAFDLSKTAKDEDEERRHLFAQPLNTR